MTGFAGSPKLLKAGLVLVDPTSGRVQRIISLQYNPEKLSRALQAQTVAADGDRADATRLKGPAVETYTLEAEIDATDQLEIPERHAAVVESGIQPQLAALELLLHPTSAQLTANNDRANAGTLEIVPMQAPLALFVWGKHRIVPVKVTDFSIEEEGFDPALNPIHATVRIGLRVLSVDDLGFAHKGGSVFMTYLRAKEQLASRATPGTFSVLGIGGVS